MCTKGICLIWSSGRNFSSSLPTGGRYLEAAKDQPRHESDTKVEIPCLIVRYDALSRGTHATGSPFFSCANISSAYA